MTPRPFAPPLCGLAAALVAGPALALPLDRKLENPTPAAGDQFGQSVALSGDRALVGAFLDDAGANDAGAAHLFDATTGALVQTLLNPTPADTDWFGSAVALSGDRALVGAFRDDAGANDAGAAYVFDAGAGALVQTLLNPTPAASDQFGWSVALSADRALVGARGDNTGASDAGAAYLFDVATGALLQTFANPTPAVGDQFGYAVALSGDRALVGAAFDDTGADDAGAAYLFDATTGALLQTFLNPTPAIDDQFGSAVALSGGRALVGAFGDDGEAGAAHLFDATTGALLRTFLNPTPAVGDRFGFSVALAGDRALVGAVFDDAGATDAGAAHLFDVNTGELLATLAKDPALGLERLGVAVALTQDRALLGAFDDVAADGVTRAGAAYLVDLPSAAVPVPAAAPLLAAALGGLGLVARRCRRAR